jgi:ABC-type phosphate/phosphonate transport system substrate-binding protein
MKTVISLAAAVVLALSAVPATAADMFQALSTIPASERVRLTPLTDDQLAAIEGENILVMIRLPLVITPENAATLISQILSYIESQLNIKLPPFVGRNVKEVIQVNIGPTSNPQSNVVEVTQQGGKMVSFTRQGM